MKVYACAIVSTCLLIAYETLYVTHGRPAISKRAHVVYLTLLVGSALVNWILPKMYGDTPSYMLGSLTLCMMINWVAFLSVFIFAPQIFLSLAGKAYRGKNSLSSWSEKKIRSMFTIIAAGVMAILSLVAIYLFIWTRPIAGG